MNDPKISVWITSIGRIKTLRSTIESWITQCSYPNYEMLIIESTPTEESSKFIDSTRIDSEATAEYLRSLPAKFPNVSFKIHIQPWKKLGSIYNQLLDESGDYYINLEDDSITCCSPDQQLRDAIDLMKDDKNLLAIRLDLRDDTVYDGCPRFPITKRTTKGSYVIWDWCSGGFQLIDVQKARVCGRFNEEHENDKYGQTEITQTEQMNAKGMYVGINLAWYGFLRHVGAKSVQNAAREWSVAGYHHMFQNGWYGGGSSRKPLQRRSSFDYPKISIWITSTGRYDNTKRTIESFLKHNTYPNYEFLIFHSIATTEAKAFYKAPDVGDEKTIELFDNLLQKHPGRLWAAPWPPLGNVLTLLMNNSEEYFLSLGDSNTVVTDPHQQLVDGIQMLRFDPQLLGLRTDLGHQKLYLNNPKYHFQGPKTTPNGDFVYWYIYPVSAQLVDTAKMKMIGFPVDHPLTDRNCTESITQTKMAELGYYSGIQMKHNGFTHHINKFSTDGDTRQWRVDGYDNILRLIESGM